MTDSRSLTQIKFESDGFVGPINVLGKDEAENTMEQVLEELNETPNRFKLHLILPTVAALARNPILVEAVQDALGSNDILLWSSDINIKRPNSPHFFAIHQDATYAGLAPSRKCLTAWVALSDPVDESSGCVCFYPRSHKLGQLHHETKLSGDNLLSLGQYIPDDCIQSYLEQGLIDPAVYVPLRGGQATLHSFDCIHSSGPNNSSKNRVGLALRYMTAEARQSNSTKEMVSWISGDDSSWKQFFDEEPALPTTSEKGSDAVERGRRIRQIAIEREEENYFSKTDNKHYAEMPR